MPISDEDDDDDEDEDEELVERFKEEQCIDYHECVEQYPSWGAHGNIYEAIRELYFRFSSWALKQDIRPCKQSVFFNIMETKIFPKDPKLTEAAKNIKNRSHKKKYRVFTSKNFFWPIMSVAIYNEIMKKKSEKESEAQTNKSQPKQKEEEKSVTFKSSKYQSRFDKFNVGDIKDFVTKVHKKGIISHKEGVLILTKPTKERLNDLFIKHFDVADARNLDHVVPKLIELKSTMNEIYSTLKPTTEPICKLSVYRINHSYQKNIWRCSREL